MLQASLGCNLPRRFLRANSSSLQQLCFTPIENVIWRSFCPHTQLFDKCNEPKATSQDLRIS